MFFSILISIEFLGFFVDGQTFDVNRLGMRGWTLILTKTATGAENIFYDRESVKMSGLPLSCHRTGIILLYLDGIPRADLLANRTYPIVRCVYAQRTDQHRLAYLKLIFGRFRQFLDGTRRTNLRTTCTPRIAITFREIQHRLENAFHAILRRTRLQHLGRTLAYACLTAVAQGIQMLMTDGSGR